MTTDTTDYYAVLGVERSAPPIQIKHAFRRLAMQYHPDRNPMPGAEELFKQINEAHEVLSDTRKRWLYDQFGSAALPALTWDDELSDLECG